MTINRFAFRLALFSFLILALHSAQCTMLIAEESLVGASAENPVVDSADAAESLGLPSLIANGDFEEGNARDADHWNSAGSHRLLRTNADSHSGKFSMHCALENDGAKPCEGRIELKVADRGNMIFGGLAYDFSFWCKTVRAGIGYVQQYRLEWLDHDGQVIGGTGFKQFQGKRNEWMQVSTKNLVAPHKAQDVRILFRLVTGSLKDSVGEVYLDDVELIPSVELAK